MQTPTHICDASPLQGSASKQTGKGASKQASTPSLQVACSMFVQAHFCYMTSFRCVHIPRDSMHPTQTILNSTPFYNWFMAHTLQSAGGVPFTSMSMTCAPMTNNCSLFKVHFMPPKLSNCLLGPVFSRTPTQFDFL